MRSNYFKNTPLDSSLVSMVSGLIMVYVAAVSLIILRKLGDNLFSSVFEVWMGLAWGIAIIVIAIILYFDRKHHVAYGVAIVVLSIASIYGTNGGELIGLVLGFMAGIMAIEYKPARINSTEKDNAQIKKVNQQ